jgi:hypothetical protein
METTSVATCNMDTKKDNAAVMSDETAVDNMTTVDPTVEETVASQVPLKKSVHAKDDAETLDEEREEIPASKDEHVSNLSKKDGAYHPVASTSTNTNVDAGSTANAGVHSSEETQTTANAGKPSSRGRNKWFWVAVVAVLTGAAVVGVGAGISMAASDRGDSGKSSPGIADGTAGELIPDDTAGELIPDDTAGEFTVDEQIPDSEYPDYEYPDYELPEVPAQRESSIDQVIAYMADSGVSDLTALTTNGTAQNRAAAWMAEQDEADMAVPELAITTQEGYKYMVRYVMAVFYYSTGGADWSFQHYFMTMPTVCEWNNGEMNGAVSYPMGVLCDKESDALFGLAFGK